jgi:hypothetical protein
MAEATEAAGLLQSGRLYLRRIGLRDRGNPGGLDLIFAGRKRGAFSIYFGDAPIYHFDLEGRWQRAFINGVHYRKALDTTIDAIGRQREESGLVLRRRSLGFAEASDLDASIRAAALDLLDRLDAGRLEPIEPPAGVEPLTLDDLRATLERISRWDASVWFAERERYCATYAPLPFLPPDCHQSIVLQATFQDLDGAAIVRTPSEFEDHARAVADLLGARALQARSIFLAGPDALRQPPDEVHAYLDAIARVFPISREGAIDEPRLDGIDAALDRFERPCPEAWQGFADRQLRRLNLELGSGAAEDLRATVAALKRARVGVRLIIPVGNAAPTDLLATLELGRGDLVYVIEDDDPTEGAALKARLSPVCTPRGAKVVTYSPEKQWN